MLGELPINKAMDFLLALIRVNDKLVLGCMCQVSK
jgi:hypothetical protein